MVVVAPRRGVVVVEQRAVDQNPQVALGREGKGLDTAIDQGDVVAANGGAGVEEVVEPAVAAAQHQQVAPGSQSNGLNASGQVGAGATFAVAVIEQAAARQHQKVTLGCDGN